ncbi:MAG TPA: alpha/beta hydrolase [Chitinophagaceae bacterium]|nr:alpha/beta hydrolase [Chitinophagaceae bacterium]
MQKKFDYKGSDVYYNIAGNGTPVMLLHGFAEDSDVWRYQIAFLQQHCLLIVPDLPGSGKSAYAPALQSIADFADCLLALLQEERIEKCIMLGHSMGGYITLAFAEKYVEYLSGFGFINSTAFADSDEKKQNRLKGIRVIEEYGGYAFIKNTTPNLFSVVYKQLFADNITALIEKGANFKKEALQQYYYAMMERPDRSGVLQHSRLPVLFVAGEEDVAAPLNDVLKQVHLPETSYIHILQNTGHMGMWEATEAVNTYVLQFIEGIE